jgi:acetyl esterase/lipase
LIEHRIGYSRRAGALHAVTKVVARPTLRYFPLRGPATRLMPLVELGATWLPRGSATAHRVVTARSWRGELVTPAGGPTSDGAVLYLHGGAFLMGGLGTHRRIVERLTRETGMPVLCVGYRKLPHARLQDSVSDCEDAFRWLVRTGHPTSRIAIVGDSAGGHLAFATALRLRDEGAGTPACLVALSPWLDFDHRTRVRHPNAVRDAYIPARRMRRVAEMVLGCTPEECHSPINADLHGLPPTLLVCAESEVLRIDSERMAERLAQAAVPVTLQVWEGQIHAFPVLCDLTPESLAACREVEQFVRSAVLTSAGSAAPLPDLGTAA